MTPPNRVRCTASSAKYLSMCRGSRLGCVEVFTNDRYDNIGREHESRTTEVGDARSAAAVPIVDVGPVADSAALDRFDQQSLRVGQHDGAVRAHRRKALPIRDSVSRGVSPSCVLFDVVPGHESSNRIVHQPRAPLHRSEIMNTA